MFGIFFLNLVSSSAPPHSGCDSAAFQTGNNVKQHLHHVTQHPLVPCHNGSFVPRLMVSLECSKEGGLQCSSGHEDTAHWNKWTGSDSQSEGILRRRGSI